MVCRLIRLIQEQIMKLIVPDGLPLRLTEELEWLMEITAKVRNTLKQDAQITKEEFTVFKQ